MLFIFKRIIESYGDSLRDEIDRTKQKLKTLPDGSISVYKNGDGYKWMHLKSNGERKYIRKKDEAFAYSLALKAFYQKRLMCLQEDYDLIRSFQKKRRHLYRTTENMFSRSAEITRLKEEGLFEDRVSEYLKTMKTDSSIFDNDIRLRLRQWNNTVMTTNPNHPENLKIRIKPDLYVRSKSEALIAYELISRGIPFKYEAELELDGIKLFPDFTIYDPITNKVIIWEHFGLVDDENYRRNMLSKLDLYIKNGYYPSVNMIITCETLDKPLDIERVQEQLSGLF